MYFVLVKGSEETVAITYKREVAEMVAEIAKDECIIRRQEG